MRGWIRERKERDRNWDGGKGRKRENEKGVRRRR